MDSLLKKQFVVPQRIDRAIDYAKTEMGCDRSDIVVSAVRDYLLRHSKLTIIHDLLTEEIETAA